MRGKVVLYFNDRVRIRLEDGREINMDLRQANSINPFMRQGDEGIIYYDDNGKLIFKIDSEEIMFTEPNKSCKMITFME